MLMGIDIRYPDFEEEYWNNKEHKKPKEAYDKLEKKSVKINIPKDFVACNGIGNTKEATQMFEFDIFQIMYPVVEERDKMLEEKLKQVVKDHLYLLADYNNLRKEYDKVKRGTGNKDYDILEQKYWDAQRTIDKYAAENEELKECYADSSNKMNLYKRQSDISEFQAKECMKDLTRWRDMYYDLQKERDELENKLLDTEDKLEETERELKGTKRYMEGYQNLYIEEVLKHKESDDEDEEKTLDIYDLEDSDGEDDDNKS